MLSQRFPDLGAVQAVERGRPIAERRLSMVSTPDFLSLSWLEADRYLQGCRQRLCRALGCDGWSGKSQARPSRILALALCPFYRCLSAFHGRARWESLAR